MSRCHYCKKILWLFPWSHYAFSGDEKYHVSCFQEMDLDLTYRETQKQYSYEDFLARLEDEDGGW